MDETSDRIGFWDREFGEHSDAERASEVYTLGSPLFWKTYGDRRFGSEPGALGWIPWLLRTYRPRRVLELGCGTGDLSLDLARRGFADRFVAVDLSSVAVEHGRAKAAADGLADAVAFRTGDLNDLTLDDEPFDLVIAQMAVHHVDRLEVLCERIQRCLSPGGSFAINEYVGPNRWQLTRMQTALANALLARMPKRYRFQTDGHFRLKVPRFTVEEMIARDPTESPRSEDIEPVFRDHFHVDHRIDYGGSIATLVFDSIVGNLREDDPKAVLWFKRVMRVDHWARLTRLVPVTNLVLAGRSRSITTGA